ncbi:MAG: hypothetical protein IT462_08575 [Planctomycetes bacterium]|nr:hypothetical protein [Planctomycetota bacterium]
MSATDDINAISSAAPKGPLRAALMRAMADNDAAAWLALQEVAKSRRNAAAAFTKAAAKARELRHPGEEKLLAAALVLEPNHVGATEAIARSYLGRGLGPQATTLLLNLRKHALQNNLTPPKHDALILAAAQAAGQTEDARAAAYRIATGKRPKWEDLISAGEFFRAEKDLDAQRTLFTRMTKSRPKDVRANLLMAAWLHDEGYNEQAAKHAQRALEHAREPAQIAEARRVLFEIKFPEDDAAFREITVGFFSADPADVAPKLQALTIKHPDFGQAWLFYGFALRRLRRLEEAAAAFGKAIEFTDDPNAHKEIGGVLGELGDPQASLAHTVRAMELLGEQDKVLWLNIAAATLELGDFANCENALNRARALDPHSKSLARLDDEFAARMIPRRGFFNARHYRVKAGAA